MVKLSRIEASMSAERAMQVVPDRYRTRFARTPADLDAILRLRFEVFNVELNEGLSESDRTGRDEDPFDRHCDHLMIEDAASGSVVGTYRMQTQEMAREGIGYYSAGEFDLSGLGAGVLGRSVEVGRACIAREYRKRSVLFLLWKGLGDYVTRRGKRYLFGCSSLSTQDEAFGVCAFRQLERSGHVHSALRVAPLPGLECHAGPHPCEDTVALPILFATYLRYGARVCGPPAIDRRFKTIDFLTLLDVECLDSSRRQLYLGRDEA